MGPMLFNCLPQHIRDLTNCDTDKFKAKLDAFLSTVPDQPLIPGYTAYRQCDTNSLLDWLGNAHLRSQMEESTRQNCREDVTAAAHSDQGR